MSIKVKNAVVYKEMTLEMKKPKLIIILTVFNALLALASICVVGGFSLSAAFLDNVSYTAIMIVYFVYVWVEACLVALCVPALTAGSISGERERQTLEVLLTTKMSTWQIVKGKFISSMLSVILIIVSSLPFMSIVFIYGGISFWQMLVVALLIVTSAMYMAAFGVWFSTLTKKTIAATVITYMFGILVIGGTLGLVVSAYGMTEMINYSLYYNDAFNFPQDFFKAGIFTFLLYLNPAVTIFDAIGHIVGYTLNTTSVNGMADLIGEIPLSGMTSKNILLRFWTPISLVVQMLVTYGMLRWSAYLLNPTRGNKKRMKRMKKVIEKRQMEQKQAGIPN